MTTAQRKEKAYLHKALIDILTDCPTDMDFLRRLIFAQEIITKEIEEFSNEEYMKAWIIRVTINLSKDYNKSFWNRNISIYRKKWLYRNR